MIVLTVDQRRSRTGPDRVPAALDALAAAVGSPVRPFERTAGDEFQGVLADGLSVAEAILVLVRQSWWSIGIGLGPVEDLPASTRAGRGPAFLAAREAVEAAKHEPRHLAVRGSVVTPRSLGAEQEQAVADVQAVAHLLVHVVAQRRPAGWEALDLIRGGATQQQAADRLGITRQAVGQRLTSAAADLDLPGRDALAHLIDTADALLTGRPD